MKIQNLLEGTIGVPQSTMYGIMNTVCTDLFSRILTYLNSPDADEYADNILAYKNLVARYRKLYGNFELTPDLDSRYQTSKKTILDMSEVNPRYLKRNPSLKNKKYVIITTVQPAQNDNAESTSGSYYKKRAGKAVEIVIYMPSEHVLRRVARNPEQFSGLMQGLYGTAYHELIHAIQDIAFGEIPDKVHYFDDESNVDLDKYSDTDYEFSPQIVSNVNDFLAYVKQAPKLTPVQKKQLILNYVNPTAMPPEGFQPYTSFFFKSLYKVNKEKWKKAAKYFYGLVHNQF